MPACTNRHFPEYAGASEGHARYKHHTGHYSGRVPSYPFGSSYQKYATHKDRHVACTRTVLRTSGVPL